MGRVVVMVRAPRSQRPPPPRAATLSAPPVPTRLPSDPIGDVARAHGYKHALPPHGLVKCR